jgi:putative ABC transport system permease protein
MLRHAFAVALRSLRRQPGYALFNATGLALGLACCFLVLLFVAHERSYDRFHADADRLFRLGEERTFQGNAMQLVSTPVAVAEALRTEVSFVEDVVQTNHTSGLLRLPEGAEAVEIEHALFASPSFFETFSFPLLAGDPARVLVDPSVAVLTESLATKLFGGEPALGRTVLFERQGFGVQEAGPIALTVTGVARDVPGTSSIRFRLLISGTTEVRDFGGPRPALGGAAITYVRTRSQEDREPLAEAVARLGEREAHGFGEFSAALVDPLPSLHFTYRSSGSFTGSVRYLAGFSVVALILLLIACINYTNLATAQAAGRAQEVGVRKTLGARRREVAARFFAEAALLAGLAALVALGLVALGLPAFAETVGAPLAFVPHQHPGLLAGMVGVAAVAAVLAGAYPALFLSGLRPALAFRGGALHGRGGSRLRQGLVVVQFTATVALLATTAVVYDQLRHMQSRDLGFEGDRVLTLDLSAPALGQQREAFRQSLTALAGVQALSFASAAPGAFRMISGITPLEGEEPGEPVPVHFAHADICFAELYGLTLAAGRYFEEGDAAGVVLNETAARTLGLMTTDAAEAIGRKVQLGREQEVVGVLRDFHFASLHHEIGGVALQPLGTTYNTLLLSVKLSGTDLPAALAAVEGVWLRLAPHHPFAYRFVDDTFDALYWNEQRLGRLFGLVAGVAVALACLGMVGLAAFAAERRRKEIGVRKVLGARVAGLVALLAGEFVGLVALAFALGAPLGYLVADRWLEGFAYRVEVAPWLLAAVGALTLALALASVSGQALRAATADPVKALRSE